MPTGVNGLRDGSVMTPEQSNLAKLLANMKVSSSGPVPVPSLASTPLPSTPHHSASTSDLQRPTLLTPKFFAARAAPSPSSSAVSLSDFHPLHYLHMKVIKLYADSVHWTGQGSQSCRLVCFHCDEVS